MKKIILITLSSIALFTSSGVFANCYTYGSTTSCSDGNSYTIQGNSMYGNNSNTGSSWSQHQYGSTNLGKTNVKSWSHTRTPYGGYGTDSSGISFSYYD
jgi:hypothetical protein